MVRAGQGGLMLCTAAVVMATFPLTSVCPCACSLRTPMPLPGGPPPLPSLASQQLSPRLSTQVPWRTGATAWRSRIRIGAGEGRGGRGGRGGGGGGRGKVGGGGGAGRCLPACLPAFSQPACLPVCL